MTRIRPLILGFVVSTRDHDFPDRLLACGIQRGYSITAVTPHNNDGYSAIVTPGNDKNTSRTTLTERRPARRKCLVRVALPVREIDS